MISGVDADARSFGGDDAANVGDTSQAIELCITVWVVGQLFVFHLHIAKKDRESATQWTNAHPSSKEGSLQNHKDCPPRLCKLPDEIAKTSRLT